MRQFFYIQLIDQMGSFWIEFIIEILINERKMDLIEMYTDLSIFIIGIIRKSQRGCIIIFNIQFHYIIYSIF